MVRRTGWRFEIRRKKRTERRQTPEEPLHVETITWGDLTWVNIQSPSERETEWLAENYNFNQLALDDCLSRKQIPKIDVFPGYLFFVFHFPMYDKATRIASKRHQSWGSACG